MLGKKISKNQRTLPKPIAEHFSDVECFEVHEEYGRIVLVPLPPNRADEVRIATTGHQPVMEMRLGRPVTMPRGRAHRPHRRSALRRGYLRRGYPHRGVARSMSASRTPDR